MCLPIKLLFFSVTFFKSTFKSVSKSRFGNKSLILLTQNFLYMIIKKFYLKDHIAVNMSTVVSTLHMHVLVTDITTLGSKFSLK